jgi:predicted transcriptional regulator of viral defense system
LLITALFLLLSACTIKSSSCADHFEEGAAPVIIKESLAKKTQLLCFEGYAVTHTIKVTGLERTLIDIAVRPVYAGGIKSVLEAYRRARSKVNQTQLAALLSRLDYVYPYHQAIGWYMDRSGYSAAELSGLATLPIKYQFYLTHQMGEVVYDEKWKIQIPVYMASLK